MTVRAIRYGGRKVRIMRQTWGTHLLTDGPGSRVPASYSALPGPVHFVCPFNMLSVMKGLLSSMIGPLDGG